MAAESNPFYAGQDLDDINDIIGPQLQEDNYSIQGFDNNIFGAQPLHEADQEFQIVLHDLKDIYDKAQKKKGNGSEQRISNGLVNIEIRSAAQISKVKVLVRRCESAVLKTNDTIGPIELPVKIVQSTADKILVAVDLDAVYKTDNGSFIYWLDRVDVEERNIWELVVITEFIDETQKQNQSKPFRIRTKPRTTKQPEPPPVLETIYDEDTENDPLLPGNKRKRASQSGSSYGSAQSPFSAFANSPGSYNPGSNFTNPLSVPTSENVITDYLEAQRAEIRHLRVQQFISTPNHDIAYHLKLQGPYYRKDQLEEGDVVGFFENKTTGETEIALMSMDNAQEARMAGVISRSAYLHGNVPKEDIDLTDTVCVIGIVRIKVAGPVQNGERIYASADKAGIGIPETQIPLRSSGKVSPILLGQSLEAAHSSKLDTVKGVKCFVSIVLGIQSGQVYSALEDVRRDTRARITESIKREKQKFFKALLCKGSIFMLVLTIIAVVLYQVFAPGSWFRFLMCKKGSIEGHEVWFTYESYDKQTPRVHGIEFKWDKLRKKMGFHFAKYNDTGMHYYLNLERCAYGGIVSVESHLDHTPQVRGPEIFAVDPDCSHAYYEMNGKWYVYKSGRDFVCKPSYG